MLCISGGDEEALAAADVGVGILDGSGCCGCWSADLVGGPGLEDAWRVLRVVAAARPLSERVVHVAQAATALGVLLALVGGRKRGKTHALAPVHTSALVGLGQGARAGRRATRARPPKPVVHVQWHALDPADVLDRLGEATGDGSDRRSLRWALEQAGESARALADKPVLRAYKA